ERILQSDMFSRDAKPPRQQLGTVHEPGRDVPVYRQCDVLVVGGGPSGTAAAAAAARAGADVVLLERYNHLGGLSTGGLVIWIDRMTDWQGKLVIRGFAEELFDRLPADTVAGATFESKEGRMAIRAKVVVDATGDGDIFARAGAAYVNDIEQDDVHHCMNTSWLFGGVDMNKWIAFRSGQPEEFQAFMAKG